MSFQRRALGSQLLEKLFQRRVQEANLILLTRVPLDAAVEQSAILVDVPP